MLKAVARTLLKNKGVNYCAALLCSAAGQEKLKYRIQRVGGLLPEYVEVTFPKVGFSRDKLTFYCAGGKEQMSRAAAAFGWQAPEAPMPLIMHSLFKTDGVFLDIGANSGYYSILALIARNRPASIYSFEPSEDALKFFRKNLELNNLGADGFEVIAMALSNQVGSAELYYPVNTHNLLETSQTLEKHHKGREEYEKTDRVEVTTLDEFVQSRSITRLDLIKIDVEGHEGAVLEGGVNTIEKLRPIIFFEVLPSIDMENIEYIFNNNNYCVFHIGKMGVSQVDMIRFSEENRNQIAVPEEKKQHFLQICAGVGLPQRA